MAFDNGVQEPVIIDQGDVDQITRANALAAYDANVQAKIKEIADRQAVLDGINEQIRVREQYMRDAYAQKVRDTGIELTNISAQVASVRDTLASLDKEIVDKMAQSAAIQTDFSAREQALADRDTALDKRGNDLGAAEAIFKGEQDAFIAEKAASYAALEKEKADLNGRSNALDARESDLNGKEVAVMAQIDQLNILLAQTRAAQADLTTQSADFDQQKAALQALKEQADAVATQAAHNALETQANAQRAETNRQDAAQIRIAKMAIANQQAELNARAQAISAAELKVGG